MNVACRGERGPFNLSCICQGQRKDIFKDTPSVRLGISLWELKSGMRQRGKSSRNPTFLHLFGFFLSSQPQRLKLFLLFFIAFPETQRLWVGLPFTLISHSGEHLRAPFFFGSNFRRKAKAPPGHGASCSLAARHPGTLRLELIGPTSSPASCLAPGNSSVLGILREHRAFDRMSPQMTPLCISQASQAFYGSNLIAHQYFPDVQMEKRKPHSD